MKTKEVKKTREIFRDNLKALMIKHQYKARELAAILSVKDGNVSKWLSGHNIPRPETVDSICSIFSIRPKDLYKEK